MPVTERDGVLRCAVCDRTRLYCSCHGRDFGTIPDDAKARCVGREAAEGGCQWLAGDENVCEPGDCAECRAVWRPLAAGGTTCPEDYPSRAELPAVIEPPIIGAVVSGHLLTYAQMGELYAKRKQVTQFFTDLEQSITAACQAGIDGTGYKLVDNRPSARWTDPDGAKVTLQIDHDMTESELMEKPAMLSPAQVREALKAKLYEQAMAAHTTGKKPTKKAAEDKARVILGSFQSSAPTGVTLAPVDDPRPAIPGAAEEFTTSLITYDPED